MVIKANELRIGNVFTRELKSTHGLEYDDITITPEIMGKIFGNDLEYALNDLFGIELTEEWLLKFGMIKQESGHYKHSGMILFSPIERTVSLEYTHDSFYFMVCISQIINHVHQFQNLYFALTGTELTINKSQST